MSNTGNIRRRIDDIDFNISHGRYEAALALLLIAVDGSARKAFPEDFKSLINPSRRIGNKERYTRFLGVRLRELFGINMPDNAYFSGVLPEFIGGAESPEEKIYVGFRCNDLHESGLPNDLKYVYKHDDNEHSYTLEFSEGQVHFSSGFLRLLRTAIVGAPCNGKEFNIQHFRLVSSCDLSFSEILQRISEKYKISPGRVDILKRLVQFVGPEAEEVDDQQLAKLLTFQLDSRLPGGAKTALCMFTSLEPLCSFENGLTLYSVQIIRDILNYSKFIDIAT
ncbi:hypothetical protein SNO30_003059 [Cronobacter sakazakii]|nr:hypothetical protein [Cronobacter sakazakii]ELY6168745.1 hypothetical protein [Cronobacter sakazakii]